MSLYGSDLVREAMRLVHRPSFVLRRADSWSDEAFEKWLYELRGGFQHGLTVIDKYLSEHTIPKESS